MFRLQGIIVELDEEVAVITRTDQITVYVSRKALPINAHKGDCILEMNDRKFIVIEQSDLESYRRDIRFMSEICYN